MSAHPTVGVVTQARTTSTRLPGKVLLPAAGQTMLDHHLDRLAPWCSQTGTALIVATTTNGADDTIVAIARQRGLGWVRGTEEDVLDRYHRAMLAYGLDVVVRVTSDCPLVDAAVVARAVETYLAADDPWTYVSNALIRTYPRGLDVEVFSADALHEAWLYADDPGDREHVTPWLHRNRSGQMRLVNVARDVDRSDLRITLDTADDYALLRTLIEDHGAASLGESALVDLLDAHPGLVALNADVAQKAVPR